MAVTFQPQNPNALFDPTQWSNQFSLFNNQAYTWPARYAGWPTDAMGNPIQAPPGMTINTSPASPQAAPAAASNVDMTALRNAVLQNQPGAAAAYGANFPGGTGGQFPGVDALAGRNWAAFTPQQNWQAPTQAAAPQPQAVANPAGLTTQQYLQLRANPGRVTTQGATVPESTSQPLGPGVLQQFLQSWKPAQTGPSSGFQQNFYNTLRGMGY